eukprot:1754909-Rhodomonas_salina.1
MPEAPTQADRKARAKKGERRVIPSRWWWEWSESNSSRPPPQGAPERRGVKIVAILRSHTQMIPSRTTK